jgi:3-hydroxymyristoyl/3-hydroxydecanoyl-(acyl carrier protein) dehydratase
LKDQWQLLADMQTMDEGTLEARAIAPEDSPWFTGHFPGEPILPGIALLDTVCRAIRIAEQNRGRQVSIGKLRRVRFTRPVRPGEHFRVSLSSETTKEDTWVTFKISVEENIVCSGQVAVCST